MNTASHTATPPASPLQHPLLNKNPRPLPNWHAWRKAWDAADDYGRFLGLILTGFDVPMDHFRGDDATYTATDRTCFYLSIADCWLLAFRVFKDMDDGNRYEVGPKIEGQMQQHYVHELCRNLATKALEMLAQHFFKTDKWPTRQDVDDYHEIWDGLLLDEKLFSSIKEFLRIVEDNLSRHMVNLRSRRAPGGNNPFEKTILTFLMNLGQYLWKWKAGAIPDFIVEPRRSQIIAYYAKLRSVIEDTKIWLLDIMQHHSFVWKLEEWVSVNPGPATMAKLKRLALDSYLRSDSVMPVLPKSRRVNNMNEALAAGSDAAVLYVKYTARLELGRRHRGRRKRKAGKKRAKPTA